MNAKNVLMFVSILVMVLAAVGSASATYYYTDDVFQEKFGKVKEVEGSGLKHEVMMYTDTEAFQAKFGKPIKSEGLVVKPFKAEPKNASEISGVEATNVTANVTLNTTVKPPEVEVIVVPVADNTTNTGNANTDNTTTNILAAGNGAVPNGSLVVLPPIQQEPNATEDQEANLPAEENTVDNTADTEISDEPTENETPASPTGEAVSGDGAPMQIAIIGILIVVIVVMLAVLLTKEDKLAGKSKKAAEKKAKEDAKSAKKASKEAPKAEESKKSVKGDWEEGTFFKEAKAKKEKKEKAVAKTAVSAGKTPVAKSEPAPAAKAEKTDSKKDVKPFLLKIRDEGA